MIGTIAVPSYKELLWPTLRAVREIGDSGTIEEIVEKVIDMEGFASPVSAEASEAEDAATQYAQPSAGGRRVSYAQGSGVKPASASSTRTAGLRLTLRKPCRESFSQHTTASAFVL